MYIMGSVGEAFDRVTIDLIKADRKNDIAAHARLFSNGVQVLEQLQDFVRAGLEEPRDPLAAAKVPETLASLRRLALKLYDTNVLLWTLEDQVRQFHPDSPDSNTVLYLQAVARISPLNDLRAGLKREIDHLLGDPFTDRKSFTTKEI